MDTNLKPIWGAHEPVVFKEEFDPTTDGRRVIWQIV